MFILKIRKVNKDWIKNFWEEIMVKKATKKAAKKATKKVAKKATKKKAAKKK